MSVLYCEACAYLIDTDEDPEAFVELTREWLCESCRERERDDVKNSGTLNDF